MLDRLLVYMMLLILALTAGCGEDGPSVYPVTGTVLYQGEPVRGASVTFQPQNGPSATGVTDESGRFSLTTFNEGDGAVPGEHHVTVIAISSPPSDEFGESLDPDVVNEPIEDDLQVESTPIPQKYADPTSSGLTQSVKEEPNDLKIELTD